MDVLTAVLAILVAIAILFEIARRVGVPYLTPFVLGGLGLAFVRGPPHISLEPELVLRLESGLRDRTEHLATEDPEETAERRQERIEHQ